MLDYMGYLNVSGTVAFVLVAMFLALQVVGELLEFKGKVVPEFLKIRKYFQRKKMEREERKIELDVMRKMPEMFENIQNLLEISSRRERQMGNIDKRLEQSDMLIIDLNGKIEKNSSDLLSLIIENKRSAIINFASHVVDENSQVTREQFNRIFKIHDEYERIIDENGLVNGEVDIAFRMINEAYETHMRNHTFLEDIRGYAD